MLSRLGPGLLGARSGDRPVVLALHGWARTHEDLVPALEASGLAYLAPDLPGFGASPEPPEPWGTAEYAARLGLLVDQMDAPIVLGHSFGGRVAVHLGARPEVRALILSGVPFFPRHASPTPAQRRYRLLRRLAGLGLVPAKAVERARSRAGSADYNAASEAMRAVLVRAVNEDLSDALARVNAPTTLFWGATDTAAPVAMAERAMLLLPDADLLRIDGAGHHVPRTHAADLGALLGRVAATRA